MTDTTWVRIKEILTLILQIVTILAAAYAGKKASDADGKAETAVTQSQDNGDRIKAVKKEVRDSRNEHRRSVGMGSIPADE